MPHGGGLQGPKCRFGDGGAGAGGAVPATVVSREEVRCVSPPLPAGSNATAAVWLVLNGYFDAQGAAGGKLRFHYSPPPQLRGVLPLGGPGAGGSLVTLTGSGFARAGAVSDSCSEG